MPEPKFKVTITEAKVKPLDHGGSATGASAALAIGADAVTRALESAGASVSWGPVDGPTEVIRLALVEDEDDADAG